MGDLISRKALIEGYGIAEKCHDCKYANGPLCKWKPVAANICSAVFDAVGVEAIPVQWIVDNYIKNHETGERKMAMVSMIFKWREENK